MQSMDVWNIVTICVFCAGIIIAICQCLCRRYIAVTANQSSPVTGAGRIQHRRPAVRRPASSSHGVGNDVYIIGDPEEPPPEYKWEELPPPSYEEAVNSASSPDRYHPPPSPDIVHHL